MDKDSYRIDRTSVKAISFEEADDHVNYWMDKTPGERLNAACFIINQIFGVTPHTKIDRSVISQRKQK